MMCNNFRFFSKKFGGPEKGRLCRAESGDHSFAAGVFGDGLGSFTDSVLGQLSW